MVDKPVTTAVTTRHAHNCTSTALMGRNQNTSQAHETGSERAKRLHIGETPIYKDSHITMWHAGKLPKDGYRINVRLPKNMRSAINAPKTSSKVVDSREENAPIMLPTLNELREMRAMSVVEFEKYLEILRDEKRIDESNCAEAIKHKLSRELGEFRDAFLGPDLNPKELRRLFDDLQIVSTRIVRITGTLMDRYDTQTDFTNSMPSGADMREIIATWLNKFTEVIIDLHPEEWEVMDEASMSIEQENQYSFYAMMCKGLLGGIDAGVIADIYDRDGEVSYKHRCAAQS
jgi:hypothetical protein